MGKLRVLDLFSGIGGFSLGLERTGGFETVAFCEIEPFPRKILAKHWPEVPCYHDVTKLTGDILARDGITVDVITGGFPCQDISVAGKQAGISEGTRSGLWSEIVRLIGELSPRYVIVENVANLLSGPSDRRGGWFGRILGDLAECGYDAEWENIPASALGAPHRRERVWLVAYPKKINDAKLKGVYFSRENRFTCNNGEAMADTNSDNVQGQQPCGFDAKGWSGQITGPPGSLLASLGRQWRVEPDVGGRLDGFSAWLDGLDLAEKHKLVSTYANAQKTRPEEMLRTLRRGIHPIHEGRPVGGSVGFSSQEVLFAYLCQLEKSCIDQARIQLARQKALKGNMRSVSPPEEPASPPRRSSDVKQHSGEHSDAVQALSRLLAHHAEKAWIKYRRSNAAAVLGWESGIARVAHGVPARTHRLAALGNSVVPQIPELIGRAILAAEATP